MNNAFLSEVLKLSNEFRADNGLAPLIANQELDAAAQRTFAGDGPKRLFLPIPD